MTPLAMLRALVLAYQADEPPEFRRAEQFGLDIAEEQTERPPRPTWRPLLRSPYA